MISNRLIALVFFLASYGTCVSVDTESNSDCVDKDGEEVCHVESSSENEASEEFVEINEHVHILIMKPGDDSRFINAGDQVIAHYTGFLGEDYGGKEFGSSRGRKPLTFIAGAKEVITGLDNAVLNMSLGQRSVIHIESILAYGSAGMVNGRVIVPPNADIVYDLEIMDIRSSASLCNGSEANCNAQIPKEKLGRLKTFSTESWPAGMTREDIPIDFLRHQQKQKSIGWQSKIREVGAKELKQLIKENSVVLVVFTTTFIDIWPGFEDAASGLSDIGLTFVQIDATKFRGTARKFHVPRVPHALVFHEGVRHAYKGPQHDWKGIVAYMKNHMREDWTPPPSRIRSLMDLNKQGSDTAQSLQHERFTSLLDWIASPTADFAMIEITSTKNKKSEKNHAVCTPCRYLSAELEMTADEWHIMKEFADKEKHKLLRKKKKLQKSKKNLNIEIPATFPNLNVMRIDTSTDPETALAFTCWAATKGVDLQRFPTTKSTFENDDRKMSPTGGSICPNDILNRYSLSYLSQINVNDIEVPSIVMIYKGNFGNYATRINQGYDAVGLVQNALDLFEKKENAKPELHRMSIEDANKACRNSTHTTVIGYTDKSEPSLLWKAFLSLIESDWLHNSINIGIINNTDIEGWEEASNVLKPHAVEDILVCGNSLVSERIEPKIASFHGHLLKHSVILNSESFKSISDHLRTWVVRRQSPLVGWLQPFNRKLYYNTKGVSYKSNDIHGKYTLQPSAILIAEFSINISDTGPKINRNDKHDIDYNNALFWLDQLRAVAKEVRHDKVPKERFSFAITQAGMEIELGQPLSAFGFSQLSYAWDHEVSIVIFERLKYHDAPMVAFPLLDRDAIEEDFEDAVRTHVRRYLAGELQPFRRSDLHIEETLNKKSFTDLKQQRLDLRNEVRQKLGMAKTWNTDTDPDDRRSKWKAGVVLKLIGKTFNHIVFDSNKDVLVKLQAHYCTQSVECNLFDSITYSSLAERMVDESSLVISTMNISENDAPIQFKAEFPELIPSIYLVKRDQDILKFTGELTLKHLISFLREHMTSNMVYSSSAWKKRKKRRVQRPILRPQKEIIPPEDLGKPWSVLSEKVYDVALGNMETRIRKEMKKKKTEKLVKKANELGLKREKDNATAFAENETIKEHKRNNYHAIRIVQSNSSLIQSNTDNTNEVQGASVSMKGGLNFIVESGPNQIDEI